MRGIWTVAILMWIAPITLAASTITGVVRNQSRGEPAVGDEVILIRNERQTEEARTQTDQQGRFSFAVQYPDEPYLVRVLHQNVNYDEHASAGSKLSIQVFDASAHVTGVAGTIEILRVQTRGKSLHVSDLCEIVNSSNPPLTQAGDRTFDVYLAADARIDSVLAAGPEKTATIVSATRLSDEPGHYSVNFPLPPGATKFAINYDLPYNGQVAFRTRHSYPLRQFAVMIPSTMRFSSTSPGFELLATGGGQFQVRAANQLKPGGGPAFEISGSGTLPSIRNEPTTHARAQLDAVPNASIRDSASKVSPAPSSFPRRSPQRASTSSVTQIIWIGASCVLLLLCVLVIARVRRAHRITAAEMPSHHSGRASSGFLQGLQHELFQLEADRTDGVISAQEYVSAKHAIDETLKRALARSHAR